MISLSIGDKLAIYFLHSPCILSWRRLIPFHSFWNPCDHLPHPPPPPTSSPRQAIDNHCSLRMSRFLELKYIFDMNVLILQFVLHPTPASQFMLSHQPRYQNLHFQMALAELPASGKSKLRRTSDWQSRLKPWIWTVLTIIWPFVMVRVDSALLLANMDHVQKALLRLCPVGDQLFFN